MTYKGVHPTAMLVEGIYPKGVKLDKKSMKPYEKCLQRLADLENGSSESHRPPQPQCSL